VNVGSWRTRLRGPPASRSAHWGSAAFLGVLHVTDVSKRAFGLEVAHVGLDLRPKNIGARLKRVEDPRLIAGQGSFTADRIVPGALHVAFRRSDQAHALISSISTSAAHEAPGVFAIHTAQDLHDLVEPVRASSRMTNYHATALYPLARDKVRYVGEPVVAVLAENRYLAEDVLDRIEIAYEPLGTVIDPEMAVREDAPLLYEEAGTNVLATRMFPVPPQDASRYREPGLSGGIRSRAAFADSHHVDADPGHHS